MGNGKTLSSIVSMLLIESGSLEIMRSRMFAFLVGCMFTDERNNPSELH